MSKRDRFTVLKRDGFTCQYCGRKPPEVTLEVDHRYSRARGGPDTVENYVTACFDCNRGKSADVVAAAWRRIDGPLDGQVLVTDRPYPVDWVYQFPESGAFTVFEDQWDPRPYQDLYNHARVLTRGQPYMRADASSPGGWHRAYEQHGEYPVLRGFYVIGNIVRGEPHLPLIWQSPQEFIEYQLSLGESLDPAYQLLAGLCSRAV